MKPFTLGGEDVHILNTFSNEQVLTLSVCDKNFLYSFEQLAFLSPIAFSYFIESSEPFQIKTPDDNKLDFINCFASLDCLFRSDSSLKITSQNVSLLLQIAEALDNSVLLEACVSFYGEKSQEFSFSSICLSHLALNSKIFLKNFTFIINNYSIQINQSLFGCVSNLLLSIDPSHQFLSFTVSDDVLQCFSSFAKIFDGIPFYWEKYSLAAINSMIDTFHLDSLRSFITQFVSLPKNPEEAIQFFSRNPSFSSEEIFQHSLSVLAENFFSLSFDQLNSLSIEVLQHLFNSDKLKIQNEGYRLHLILKLIEKEPNMRILLQNVQFHFLSSKSLKTFFDSFHEDDIDFDLFEQIKKGFQILKENYEFLSQEQNKLLEECYNLKNSIQIFENERNELFKENQSLKIENQRLYNFAKELEQTRNKFSNEILDSKNQLSQEIRDNNLKVSEEIKKLFDEQALISKAILTEVSPSKHQGVKVDLNEHSGIMEFLRKSDPNSVSVSCENLYAGSPENLLKYDVSSGGILSNPLGSWIFKFQTKKILLSGYFLRSYNSFFPQGWKLLGSNDSTNWALIEELQNQTYLNGQYKEHFFPCQTQTSFSCFKIQANSRSIDRPSTNYLYLSFVEFAGIILDQ